MFEVGFAELFLLGVIALLVVGPDRLPALARTVGVWVGRAQRLVGQVRADIEREVRADELRKAAKEYSPTGVLSDMRKEVEDFASEASKPVDLDTKEDGEEKAAPGRSDPGESGSAKSDAGGSGAGDPGPKEPEETGASDEAGAEAPVADEENGNGERVHAPAEPRGEAASGVASGSDRSAPAADSEPEPTDGETENAARPAVTGGTEGGESPPVEPDERSAAA